MIDDLGVRAGLDGRVVRHRVGDVRPRTHRHAELEVNLGVRGTASYLLGDRRYALTPGMLTWLFPGQDHVLVDDSSDHELWWAVFRPALVPQIATTPHARPLLAEDPVGQFSRRLDSGRVRRLSALFHEVQHAETVDDILVNTGLAYLLSFAGERFSTAATSSKASICIRRWRRSLGYCEPTRTQAISLPWRGLPA